jgi:hypothetical protein
MSANMSAHGTLTAEAGVLRSHAADREYPFVMERGDILHVGGEHHINFTEQHTFNSREEQNKFVADWKTANNVAE